MAEPTTFIKLDRNIREWRWYKDPNTMRVFVDLLLDVNISDKEFMGITIHRGETATSSLKTDRRSDSHQILKVSSNFSG